MADWCCWLSLLLDVGRSGLGLGLLSVHCVVAIVIIVIVVIVVLVLVIILPLIVWWLLLFLLGICLPHGLPYLLWLW